jgi:hypothetical protein
LDLSRGETKGIVGLPSLQPPLQGPHRDAQGLRRAGPVSLTVFQGLKHDGLFDVLQGETMREIEPQLQAAPARRRQVLPKGLRIGRLPLDALDPIAKIADLCFEVLAVFAAIRAASWIWHPRHPSSLGGGKDFQAIVPLRGSLTIGARKPRLWGFL